MCTARLITHRAHVVLNISHRNSKNIYNNYQIKGKYSHQTNQKTDILEKLQTFENNERAKNCAELYNKKIFGGTQLPLNRIYCLSTRATLTIHIYARLS